jgi:DNA-binding response OmpR family regulator
MPGQLVPAEWSRTLVPADSRRKTPHDSKEKRMEQTIKVLLVDDEAAFRVTTGKILAREGFIVQSATNGEQALSSIRENEPDVVVLDLNLDTPGYDGTAVLRAIRRDHPMVAVIMLTGYASSSDMLDAACEGAFDYLAKPCDISYLASRIREAHRSLDRGLAWMGEKQAADLMIPIHRYARIRRTDTVRQAFGRLLCHNRSMTGHDRVLGNGRRSLLVLDFDDRIVGYLTCRELLAALHKAHAAKPRPVHTGTARWELYFWRGVFTRQVEDLLDVPVSTLMDPHSICVDAGSSLQEVAEVMFAQNVRRVLVTDGGEYVGVIRDQELFAEIGEIALDEKEINTLASDGISLNEEKF